MNGLELKFRLAGVPVRIEPGFWLLSAVLGWTGRGVGDVLVWVSCVLVAVLCHELGHAMAARAFGGEPEITLYSMGGVTHPKTPDGLGRWHWIAISLAGPMAGFVFGALVFVGAMIAMPPAATPLWERAQMVWELVGSSPATLRERAVTDLLWINIGWGAVNLFPVLPLDGGNVARMLLGPEETGFIRALAVSSVVGPAVAFGAYWTGQIWAAMLFALFSVSAVRQLIELGTRRADRLAGLDASLHKASEALEEHDYERAQRLAEPVAAKARNASLRYAGTHVLGIALLEQGKAEQALAALQAIPPSHADDVLIGACLLHAGRPAEAVPHLETAARRGAGEPCTSLLAQAIEQSGAKPR